ncbi:MAG: PAS domain-containing protein [Candidatus Pacebacteria bacterium]|nr:PAS domain-containing protein [Candidatus Paceibacterota bacterium]
MNTTLGVKDPLGDLKDGHVLARAIIDTIREPLIVLDGDLRIIAASGSFFKKFALSHDGTYDTMFYDLGNGEWNIPALRILLEQIIPEHTVVEDYEVTHEFLRLGRRTMLVNAREIRFEEGKKKMLLLSIHDVTEQRLIEADLAKLASQKTIMLAEMRHRIANSLQLIASILMLKAVTVASAEARAHLEDAHSRIVSISNVQRHLDPMDTISDHVEIAPYLVALCKSLEDSMIGGRKPIELMVKAGPGNGTSDEAVSIGLLTTELVINALKYAFPSGEGKIVVSFSSAGHSWSLSIKDNGIGYVPQADKHGLGTSIVQSLATQLDAVLTVNSGSHGTEVLLVCSST